MDFVLIFSYAFLGALGFVVLLSLGIALLLRRRKKTAAKVFGAIGCLALIGILYLGSSVFADDPTMSLKQKAWPAFRLFAVPMLDPIARESKSNGHFMTGLTADISGLHKQAIEEYKLSLLDTASVNRIFVLGSIGNTYMLVNKNEEAVTYYDSLLILQSYCATAWDYRGMCLAKLGKLEQAAVSFDSALFYDPKQFNAAVISDYDRGKTIRPNAHRAWSLAAKTLLFDKQYEQAIVCFDSALTYPGDHANSWYFRGLSQADLKEHEKALSCYDSALACETPQRETWLTNKLWQQRSSALHEIGRFDEALVSIDSALSDDPKDSTSVELRRTIERDISNNVQNSKVPR